MKIKVCGLRLPENIAAVSALAPDYEGFIFYKPSPRFVEDLDTETVNNVPVSIITTAVFVNETEENIANLISKYNFGAIQLHGNEAPGFCSTFKGKVKVLKAFGIDKGFDFDSLNEYTGKVDYFLFDAKTDIHGGSGKTFDWAMLDKYTLDVPFFLSGGISPENIGQVMQITHPMFYGVDLNSKFELSPGDKDISKLEKAFDIIKQTIDK